MNYKLKYNNNIASLKSVKEAIDDLNNKKDEIEKIIDKWEIVKKRVHKYEYVYTSYNSKKNVADVRPISRSYFKLIEILKRFNRDNITSALCLAEGPGGFIQVLKEQDAKKIYGITLLSTDNKIPRWNKRIKEDKDIILLGGVKDNGDLYDIENILSFVKTIGRDSIELITGDGGIDYSEDYNSQETSSVHIIYSEILISLLMQKEGGMFICKIFDIYDIKTIKLIYILYKNYEDINIYKPCISRLTNSEKYIVCKGCKSEKRYINEMLREFENKEIDIEIPKKFIESICNISIEYINIQIKSIDKAIKIASEGKINKREYQEQILAAKEWCIKNDINIRK